MKTPAQLAFEAHNARARALNAPYLKAQQNAMKTTATLSDRLAISPAGLVRYNPENGHAYACHGIRTYAPNGFMHFSTSPLPITMTNKYPADYSDPARPLWKGILYASVLSAAIAGLIACLGWFAFAAFTI